MRKTAITAMLSLAAAAFLPVMPVAHAALADELLTRVVAQNPAAANIQDIFNLKQELESGDSQALIGRVAQAALEKVGQGEAAGLASTLVAGGDIRTVIETAVRQEVQDRVAARIGPYQDGLTLLATLLGNSGLTPQAAREDSALAGAPENYRRILDMTATAYAPGPLDNGRWNDLTHLGGRIAKGVVAVDPRIIPLGTKLWVEGYGAAVAADTGSAIKGNRVDLAFDTRREAAAYGIKNIKVYVLD